MTPPVEATAHCLDGTIIDPYARPSMSLSLRVVAAIALACVVAGPLRAAEQARAFDPEVARRITPDEVQQRRAAGEKPVILDTRSSLGDMIAQGAVHVTNDDIATW